MSNLAQPANDARQYRDALSAVGKVVTRTCSSFDRIEHAWESNYDLTADDIDLLIRIVNDITEAVISGLSKCRESASPSLAGCHLEPLKNGVPS